MIESASGPARQHGGGDGWVELADGRRFWGRVGAAGLLAVDPEGRVLLQHRVAWSHFGGTWGLPGGARDPGESALAGALREAREETGVDTAALQPRFAVLLDLGAWSYTTVAVAARTTLPVAVSDRESTALEWVPGAEVDRRELHPGFGAAWPRLRAELAVADPVLVVDAANVVGSRPDGWWRDRARAADRLLAGLARLAAEGLPEVGAPVGDLPVVRRWPSLVVVLEGAAKSAADVAGVEVLRAERDGDADVVRSVGAAVRAGRPATAVTADRALADRVRAAGGEVVGPGWLRDLIDR